MSQSFAVLPFPRARSRVQAPVLAPAEIDQVERAFVDRDPATTWVGYATMDGGRLALFFHDGGDPVLTLARDGDGAITLSDQRGATIVTAYRLSDLLRWLKNVGPDRD